MEIPKIIHQTWYKKDLPSNIKNNIEKIKKINPDYEYKFYDDNDILTFIKNNCDSRTLKAYNKLTIGASKADLFRYLILYKEGGIYLDIDSMINKNLDSLIEGKSAVISREENKGYFLQWMMIFCKEHPVLKKVIEKTINNILEDKEKDIVFLTGPWGPYTDGIKEVLNIEDLWEREDNYINNKLKENEDKKIKNTFFYGTDYKEYAEFKSKNFFQLYFFKLHWKQEQWLKNNKYYVILFLIFMLFFISYFLFLYKK